MSPEEFLVFQGFALLVGLCVGSFLNVCIARMPHDQSVVHPGSHCPACGAAIRSWDNIPVLSWLLLRARCRRCKVAISPLYPTVELLTGVLSLLLFRHVMPVPEAFGAPLMTSWALHLVFLSMLLGTTFVDLKHYIIPDQFSIYAIPMGVAACALLHYLGVEGVPSWPLSVLGAVVGGGSLLLIMGAYWLIRREEGMGMGDVKLLAMIGAWLGPVPALPVIILLASVAGSVLGLALLVRGGHGLRSQLPFGPFLALGSVAYFFFWDSTLKGLLPGLAF